MENRDIVYEAIKKADKPLKPGEIAELAGLSKEDTDKAITQLKKEEKIYSPKRCFYEAKKD